MNNGNGQDTEIDFSGIRIQAHQSLSAGAVLDSERQSAKEIATMLDGAMATELVCTLRYHQNANIADQLGAEVVANEFREHAAQEFNHAQMIAKRISLLGATPDFTPSTLERRSHADYAGFSAEDGGALVEMLEANLVAERIAIGVYRAMIQAIGDRDPTSRRLLERILEEEEEHADEIAAMLGAAQMGPMLPLQPSL